MKRPLFILAVISVCEVLCFNYLGLELAAGILAVTLLFMLIFISSREIKAVFSLSLLIVFASLFITYKENEKIRNSFCKEENNYDLCCFDVGRRSGGSYIKGKLILRKEDLSLKDVSVFVPSDKDYKSGDVIHIDAYVDFEGNEKINLRPFIKNVRLSSEGKNTCKTYKFFGSFRERLNEASLDIYPSENAGIFPALLTGNRNYMTEEMKEAVYDGGISHITAVSGLHLSVILGFVFMVFKFRKNAKLAAALAISLFIAGISGFTPSVIRASLMFVMIILASILSRNSDGITSLSFFVTAAVIFKPELVFSLSMQFSCLSVLGILAIFPYAEKIMPSAIRNNAALKFLFEAAAVSFSASFLTLVPSLFYFGSFPILSLILNIAVVPAASFMLPLIWTETLMILLFDFHIPFIDFILEKGAGFIIDSAKFSGKFRNMNIAGYRTGIVIFLAIMTLILFILIYNNVRFKKVIMIFVSMALVFLPLHYFYENEEKGRAYIFFDDRDSFCLIKSEDDGFILKSPKRQSSFNDMHTIMKTFGIKNIKSFCVSYDDAVLSSFLDFVNDFGFILDENFLSEDVTALECKRFISEMNKTGIRAVQKENKISLIFRDGKILKTDGKCVIMTDKEKRKIRNINIAELKLGD